MNIGFLGGSFNPPHYGHLFAALYAISHFNLDHVWLAPVKDHPFGKSAIDFHHRLAMTQALVQPFTPQLKVTDIEAQLKEGGKTLHTLNALADKYPDHNFSLLVGSDIVPELPKWHAIDQIRSTYPIHIIPRGQNSGSPFYIPNISSTWIRRSMGQNKMPSLAAPKNILAYVEQHKLYVF